MVTCVICDGFGAIYLENGDRQKCRGCRGTGVNPPTGDVMAKKQRLPDVQLQVIGHELVTRNVKVSRGVIEERKMVKIKFQGVAGDKATRMVFEVDVKQRERYPFGSVMLQSMELQQLELGDGEAEGEAEDAAGASAGH